MVRAEIDGRVTITEFHDRHGNIAARCKEMFVEDSDNKRILEVEVYSPAGVKESIEWLSQFCVNKS